VEASGTIEGSMDAAPVEASGTVEGSMDAAAAVAGVESRAAGGG
jgi:hypothetical protein